MASAERTQEILKGLREAVVAYDEEAAARLSKAALAEGVSAYDAVRQGLAAGMEKVGEMFAKHEYFVPEVLLCSDALYAGLDILRPHIRAGDASEVRKQIVLGTVEGDVHDIGKNLVKIMFEAAGWLVHDLGTDVKLEKFAEEQARTNADIVGLSALMTSTMLAMPRVIQMIKARSPGAAVMVGGAPLSPEIARQYGADGYARNAGEAVREAVNMLSRLGTKG
ncbi:MAG: corrinoid protein [Chloroflexota bacterium]|nr:corrinoid protein [Chloroflexota bacterium]